MRSKSKPSPPEEIKGDFLPDLSFKEKAHAVGSLRLRFADLKPADLRAISMRLIDAQEKLKAASIFKIVDWIDGAAARWRDPDDAFRKKAERLIPLGGGLSEAMLRHVLDDVFQPLTRPILLKFLEEELGDAARLDRFCPKEQGNGFTRAFGPRLITQIVPNNISGLSITALVCGLLVKSANLLRVGPGESLLPALFAQSLQESWPEMAKAAAIVTWDKNVDALSEAAFQHAECAVLYGGDETLSALRQKMPIATKVVSYGHRFSLGLVARESIHAELADRAALDIALYDQKGCLSPQLYYVENGGGHSPLDFARWLARALYAVSLRLPKGPISPGEAAQIQQIRSALPLKGGRVFSSPDGLDWSVFYDPDAAFTCSPLSRSIWIKPVEDLAVVPFLLEKHRLSLQAVGVALPEARQAELIPKIAQAGGSRICPIGQMQKPPITWHHDGGFRLLPLLRFVDWENP